MDSTDRPAALFIDFENVPDIDLARLQEFPVRVTLLIGKNQKKLDLALVRQIHQLGDRIRLVEVGASGHNALDIVLACYLGQALQQDRATPLHIVSGDKDFDPLVAHLRQEGVSVSRAGKIDDLPFLAGTRRAGKGGKQTPGPERGTRDPLEKLVRVLKSTSSPRPRTRARLLAAIKNSYGKALDAAGPEGVLGQLEQRGVIAIGENGRITYQ